MKTTITTALITCSLLFASCGPSPQAVAQQQAAWQQQMRETYAEVARVAAANWQLADPPSLDVQAEGSTHSVYDANVLPQLELMRFLARDGIAIRQEVPDPASRLPQVRFYIRDEWRGNVSNGRFHFGRWVVTDVQIVPDGMETVREGVLVRPVDVTLRLVDIPSRAWLAEQNASVIERHLQGLPTLTSPVTVRAELPTDPRSLPAQGKVIY